MKAFYPLAIAIPFALLAVTLMTYADAVPGSVEAMRAVIPLVFALVVLMAGLVAGSATLAVMIYRRKLQERYAQRRATPQASAVRVIEPDRVIVVRPTHRAIRR